MPFGEGGAQPTLATASVVRCASGHNRRGACETATVVSPERSLRFRLHRAGRFRSRQRQAREASGWKPAAPVNLPRLWRNFSQTRKVVKDSHSEGCRHWLRKARAQAVLYPGPDPKGSDALTELNSCRNVLVGRMHLLGSRQLCSG
jgi:hypothetical protein